MSTRNSPRSDQTKLDDILGEVKRAGWTLGRFLYLLFTDFSYTNEYRLGKVPKRSKRHATFVHGLLSETPKNTLDGIEHIIAAIYNHHDSAPTQRRNTAAGPAAPLDDHTKMARHKLLLWACHTVSDKVHTEMAHLAKEPQLRLPTSEQNWETVSEFSLQEMRQCVQSTAPTLYGILLAAGTPQSRASDGRVRAVKTVLKRDPEIVSGSQYDGSNATPLIPALLGMTGGINGGADA